MRISRPSYNNERRCPGWNGPGWRYDLTLDCAGGYLTEQRISNRERSWPTWRLCQCPTCGRVILPEVARWLDPTWYLGRWRWFLYYDVYNWRQARQWRREDLERSRPS